MRGGGFVQFRMEKRKFFWDAGRFMIAGAIKIYEIPNDWAI